MPSRDDIFLSACEIKDPGRRAEQVAEACGGDEMLLAQIQEMLRDAAQADGYFGAQDGVAAVVPVKHPGDRIGRYKLLEKIGEGGMGVVYMAEQEYPVRRHVAFKIIKAGMDTRQVVARFEAERQALALMDHPNIAKVLDAGATETGRPYFVMDLVQGLPITRFCDEAKLSTRERLRLLLDVCGAIQHAHQKGIIHRDLKPSNILVTLQGDQPVPKVIDFGIAKATQGRLTDKTLFTQFQHFIGTPAYMSPEQASLSGLDVDTRSDIYALGVLLYELLTGLTPFDEKELLRAGLDEMRRTIQEREPLRPSTRLGQMESGQLSLSAASRRAEAPALIHLLRGDLDWIVMKAIEKDRSRRYETANGLAADIHRHLNTEPVRARPPSQAYRLQKFVRRNKLQVTAATAVGLVLILGICLSLWQAARAETRLEAMLHLTKEAFQNVLPALGDIQGAFKAREAMVNAAQRIIEELQRDPNPSSEVRQLLATCYLELSSVQSWLGYSGSTTGQFEQGLQSARRAIHYLESTGTGPRTDAVVQSLARAELAATFANRGLLHFDEALEHIARLDGWGALLSRSTNAGFADFGRRVCTWTGQLTALTLIGSGRSGQALEKHLGKSLPELRKRAGNWEVASFGDLWDFDGEIELLGAAHLDLGHLIEAAKYLSERLQVAELAHRRWPYHAGWSGNLGEARANMGEVLLALGQEEESLTNFQAALQLTESMQQVDPENAGLVMLKVRILYSRASGYVGWAQNATDSVVERQSRLDQAQALLDQAEALVVGVKSESFRRFLRYELGRTADRLKSAREKLTDPAGDLPDPPADAQP